MNNKEKIIPGDNSYAIVEEMPISLDMHCILSQHGDKLTKLICANTKELVFVISLDGKIIYINPSFYNLGYSSKDLLNQDIVNYVHPDDTGIMNSLLLDCNIIKKNQISLDEYSRNIQFRIASKFSDWIEFESNISIIHDYNSSFAILFISREIVNQRQQFNELKEWTDTFDAFVAKFDINGFMLFCNASLLKLGGVSEADVYGKYFPDTRLLSHSYLERDKIIKAFNNSKAFLSSRIECSFLGADNKAVQAIFNCQPVMDDKGNIKYITGEGKTITEEIILRNKLIESNANLEKKVVERTIEITEINQKLKEDIVKREIAEKENIQLAAIPRESPHPILSSDSEGKIIYQNPAAQNMMKGLGLNSPIKFLPGNHRELVESCLKDKKSYHNLETRVKGHVLSWTYNPLPDIKLIHLHGLDITDQKYLEEKLLHDTQHDKLTGLPNRSFIYDELLRAIKISQRRNDYHFAVLFIDLGRFKAINDSLGHLIGDKVLTEVAERIASCLRPEDTAARFGGDEFTILLNNITDANDPIRVSERIQKKISLPMTIEGNEILPSASIGIVLSNPEYIHPEDLIRDANTAMYQAKSKGVSKYAIYDTTMQKHGIKLIELENSLQCAIDRKEFSVLYQPIVSLESSKIVGLEALIRWQHPKNGLIPPDEFMPIAEETGQIIPIGEWVIRKACSQLRLWHKKYPEKQHLFISINLSARQFSQPGLIEKISKILEDENLYPGYLNLEITESIIMSNYKKINAMLVDLRKMDIQISIDDFGVGYSSLSNLHLFPIQMLKIDRSFIAAMNGEDSTSVVPNTIISLSKHMEMDVIAEGVETLEQVNHLKKIECGYAQGNFFSPPVNSESVELLIANNPRW